MPFRYFIQSNHFYRTQSILLWYNILAFVGQVEREREREPTANQNWTKCQDESQMPIFISVNPTKWQTFWHLRENNLWSMPHNCPHCSHFISTLYVFATYSTRCIVAHKIHYIVKLSNDEHHGRVWIHIKYSHQINQIRDLNPHIFTHLPKLVC